MATRQIDEFLERGTPVKDGMTLEISAVEFGKDSIGAFVKITSKGEVYKTYSKVIIKQLKDVAAKGFKFGDGEDVLVAAVRERRSEETGNNYLSL